ncbi:hypothetical protein [Actinokineospora bangkokensis]|uniref:hypothetical protein n=1 Tax=Actinokineospora bangkokensis TaxID=1193682 RepID=UPI001301362A|nr:hypothetical protein [Actinokineospora bangkokensis]
MARGVRPHQVPHEAIWTSAAGPLPPEHAEAVLGTHQAGLDTGNALPERRAR